MDWRTAPRNVSFWWTNGQTNDSVKSEFFGRRTGRRTAPPDPIFLADERLREIRVLWQTNGQTNGSVKFEFFGRRTDVSSAWVHEIRSFGNGIFYSKKCLFVCTCVLALVLEARAGERTNGLCRLVQACADERAGERMRQMRGFVQTNGWGTDV